MCQITLSPNRYRPYLMHDNSDILKSCTSCYKKQVEHIRRYFQQQHQNWFILDGLKSKWWLWTNIMKEVSISMKHIQSYLEKTQSGKSSSNNQGIKFWYNMYCFGLILIVPSLFMFV